MLTTRTRDRRPRTRLAAVTALLLLAVPLLTGCLRVQVSMGVSADDRVSGQLVAATVPTSDQDKGPELTTPDSLIGKVRVQEYKQDGFVGSQVFFTDLTFGEVQQLGSMSSQVGSSVQLNFQRAGDVVVLDGKADLKAVPESSDVQISVAFPARVATTNGTRDGDSVVTWKLAPGEVNTLRAEVRYQDPSTRGFAGWAGIVGGVTLGVALIVGVMAYRMRDTSPRYLRGDGANKAKIQGD
ncbi:LppM family (lipo)protein [Rhodococcus sp. NPDC058505]|uniref:LppM family (lipo)protein n=1 Tax=unclassified Rhodococcus (in: high G+C Gram-positive bacteria) TaxID=192944 RepID=UPI0036557C48